MDLGLQNELRDQIIDVAIIQACMHDQLPTDTDSFQAACEQGRLRLGLLIREIAGLVMDILQERQNTLKKLPQAKPWANAYTDLQSQLQQLCHKWFIRQTPFSQLKHFVRYLKAAQMRIDKLRENPGRDQTNMAEFNQLYTLWHRATIALKGAQDAQLDDFRWQLEELRVALYAQKLRTPYPVSVKRLHKSWALISH